MKEIINAVSTLMGFLPSSFLPSVSEEVKEVFGGEQSLNVSYMKLSCSLNPWKKGAVRTPGAKSRSAFLVCTQLAFVPVYGTKV